MSFITSALRAVGVIGGTVLIATGVVSPLGGALMNSKSG
jgi:hypothetical protein